MESPRVALMQPTFMPWQGYFSLLGSVDLFVFLDDFQFSRRSYDQRNRFFTAKEQASWVTVPVEHRGDQEITFCEAYPVLTEKFRTKFLKQIRNTYASNPYFEEIFPLIEQWITADWLDLASLNIEFIKIVSNLLKWNPKFLKSSNIACSGKRSWRLAKILQSVGAKSYLSARGSFCYMRADGVFPLETVTTYFQDFVPASYPQKQSKTFISHLSVLDGLLQVGAQQTRVLIEKGQRGFVPWCDMVKIQ